MKGFLLTSIGICQILGAEGKTQNLRWSAAPLMSAEICLLTSVLNLARSGSFVASESFVCD